MNSICSHRKVAVVVVVSCKAAQQHRQHSRAKAQLTSPSLLRVELSFSASSRPLDVTLFSDSPSATFGPPFEPAKTTIESSLLQSAAPSFFTISESGLPSFFLTRCFFPFSADDTAQKSQNSPIPNFQPWTFHKTSPFRFSCQSMKH